MHVLLADSGAWRERDSRRNNEERTRKGEEEKEGEDEEEDGRGAVSGSHAEGDDETREEERARKEARTKRRGRVMDVGADLRVVRAPVTAVVSACSKLTLGFTRLGHGNAPQSFNQFLVNGCANCPFLKLIDDKERIRDCTSSSFTGFVRPSALRCGGQLWTCWLTHPAVRATWHRTIALMDPQQSWVARWQRTSNV